MDADDVSRYSHSPAHLAVFRRDHSSLRRLVSSLPSLPDPATITTESASIASERTAERISSVIDRRDVPNRETPLHLAVRLRDPVSADILMSAGANPSLQNSDGWKPRQEAIFRRDEAIAQIITRHLAPLFYSKWSRRLPRVVATISRIRDFYMEMTFHFESSMIPFIARVAPSDTYKIWKKGGNFRTDMTLAGFDNLKIKRSEKTIMFLGEGKKKGSNSPELPIGSLIVVKHKKKDILNALKGFGARPTEAQVANEVAVMMREPMCRPGMDVTQAELVAQMNWRRGEKTEMVGSWKAKIYDMHNVTVSMRTRRAPCAVKEEVKMAEKKDEFHDALSEEEKQQLETALTMKDGEEELNWGTQEKKGWLGWNNNKKDSKPSNGKKSSKTVEVKKGMENNDTVKKKKNGITIESTKDGSKFKKGLSPVLWLTPDFPLKMEELLPMLDVLADKVKAVRRLRALLTTKMPQGTFPVKV